MAITIGRVYRLDTSQLTNTDTTHTFYIKTGSKISIASQYLISGGIDHANGQYEIIQREGEPNQDDINIFDFPIIYFEPVAITGSVTGSEFENACVDVTDETFEMELQSSEMSLGHTTLTYGELFAQQVNIYLELDHSGIYSSDVDDLDVHVYINGVDRTTDFAITSDGYGFDLDLDTGYIENPNIVIVASVLKKDYDITFNVVGVTYSPTTETYEVHDDTDAILFTAIVGYTWDDSIVQIIYGGVDVTSQYWDEVNKQIRSIQDLVDDVQVNVTLQPMIQIDIEHNNIISSAFVYKPKSMMLTQVENSTIINITQENGVIVNITYASTPISSDYQLIGLKYDSNIYLYKDVNTLVDIKENITLVEYIEQIPSLDSGLDLYLYESSAEINMVDKTSKITQTLHLTGILREGTTLVNPTIVVESSIIPIGNYAWIPQFKRYYFVEDIVADYYNKWRIVLRADVLMSYRNTIRQQTGFIARNEFDFNDYLIDDERLTTDDYITTKYELNDANVFDYSTLNPNSIVLTIASSLFTDSVTIWNKNNDDSSMNEYPHGDSLYVTNTSRKVIISKNQAIWFSNRIVKGNFSKTELYSDLSEYVLSVKSYPFNIDTSWRNGWGYDNVAVGGSILKEGSTYLKGYYVDSTKQKYFDFNIEKYFNNFMDYAPYTTIKMYIAYIGIVDLDTNKVMGEELRMWYMIDFDNGTLNATLMRKRDSLIVGVWSSTIAVDLPIGRTNETDRQRNKANQDISLAVGLSASLVSAGVGVATGNPLAFVGGVMGLGKTIASNQINNINNNQQHFSSTKLSGELSKIYLPQRAYIEIKRPNPIPVNESEYNHLKGKPLGEYRTLSTMRGFTILDNVHLKGFTIATEDEIKEIETHLLTGVIL